MGAALDDCGYTRAELAEFRKVFQTFDDDGSGEISSGEIEAMFGGLVKLTSKAVADLHKHLSAIDKDGDRSLSFAEFLRLMRKLQDKNWGDINTTSAGVAASLESGNED